MKTQLLKRQIVLILSITFGMFFFYAAHAQIVYTDVNPDQYYSSGSYNLDLNNDGVNDFTLTITSAITTLHCTGICENISWTGATTTLFIIPLAKNDKVAAHSGFASEVDENTLIDSTSFRWSNNEQVLAKDAFSVSSCSLYHGCHPVYGYSGDWVSGATDKYLGVRIQVNSQTFYGWVRLDVPSYDVVFTIKDYAYNSIPDQSILAGQTCPPKAKIKANGSTTFCKGESVVLSSVNTGTDLSYQWQKGKKNISGATASSYTATKEGNYKVIVNDNLNNCSGTSSKIKVTVNCRMSGENGTSSEMPPLKVYPNPLTQTTTISFSLSQPENVSLKIFDVEGRLIRTLANESMSAGTHELTWNARDENGNEVSAGIYLLQLQSSEFSQIQKLIVNQ